MSNARAFGALLGRIRQQQGFPTAYAFFRDRKGRDALNISYRNYLFLEQGKSLPKVESLEKILLALGLGEYAPAAQELVDSYFSALGFDRLDRFRRISKASPAEREDLRLGELAARHALQKNSVQWSIEQYKLLAADFEACLANDLLVNTRGGLDISEVAAQTGLSLAAAKRAVRALVGAALAKISGGRARSLMDDKFVLPPPQLPAMTGVLAALRRHDARLAEKSPLIRNAPRTVRLTETNLLQYQRHIDQLMEMGELYNNQENTPDSAVYLVWAQIFKLFPRKASQARSTRRPAT